MIINIEDEEDEKIIIKKTRKIKKRTKKLFL
jgi:hypothetical protein